MWSAFLTMAALHWVVLITPGVNFVLVSQLAASGRRDLALAAVLGICSMTFLWALLALLGLGAIFAIHPGLRQLVQVVGGAYLCFLAFKLWSAPAGTESQAQPQGGRMAAFQRGFLTNLLNPKPALFFGSVFATTLPSHLSWGWLFSAVALVVANALAWHLFLTLAFSRAQVQRWYDRCRAAFNRLSSALLGAFAVRLAVVTWQEWRARA